MDIITVSVVVAFRHQYRCHHKNIIASSSDSDHFPLQIPRVGCYSSRIG